MSDLFLCLCRVFRAAMTSIQQLRGDLISTGDTPSTTLTTYFKVSEKKRFLLKRNSFKIKTSLEKNIFPKSVQTPHSELHRGPDAGRAEAFGDVGPEVQPTIWSGRRTTLRPSWKSGEKEIKNELRPEWKWNNNDVSVRCSR